MPQRLLARMPTREQLEARIMIILTLMGGLAQIAQVSLDMLVQLLMSDLSGYYVSAGIMLTEDATTRIDAHANAQWAIVQSGDVPAGLRLGDEVIISGLAGRADLNEKAGEIIGRYDAAAERFPVNVGGENVRIRCKNLRAVQGAYETPIANGCDVSKSYGYSVKDGRREPSTNPLAPELCLALGAKSAAEMEAVASIGPQGAARMLDVLEGCRGARFKRRSNAEDDEAARSGGAKLDRMFTAALQADEDFAMGSRAKEWPLGEGDDGPWHKGSGLPRGYVQRDGRTVYVGGIPRKLAQKWKVGAGELGYEGEPHTAETKEDQEAGIARLMAEMSKPGGMFEKMGI